MKWFLLGELARARSRSVFEPCGSFSIPNARLALLEMAPSIDDGSCWFRPTGEALAICFTVMKELVWGELATARSPSFFELRSSFGISIECLALLKMAL